MHRKIATRDSNRGMNIKEHPLRTNVFLNAGSVMIIPLKPVASRENIPPESVSAKDRAFKELYAPITMNSKNTINAKKAPMNIDRLALERSERNPGAIM